MEKRIIRVVLFGIFDSPPCLLHLNVKLKNSNFQLDRTILNEGRIEFEISEISPFLHDILRNINGKQNDDQEIEII